MTTILVTGATGTVGSRVVHALQGIPGIEVRAGVRDVHRAPAGSKAVQLDFADPASVASALSGVDKVFLVTPLSDAQVEQGIALVDAAASAGVRQIVKLSTSGAEFEPGILLGRWHRAVERHIESSSVPWTILRPGAYMTNFIVYFPPDAQGNVYPPLGDSASSYIDPRDIADAAAACLTGEGHLGKHYTLTGPEAITTAQAVSCIAKATGRTLRYIDVPEDAARAAMAGMGAPPWLVQGMLELYGIMRAGWTAGVSDGVPSLTGHAGRSFAVFARDNAAAWQA